MKRRTLPTKLHIGAFNSPVDGWLNTDITPHIFITRIPFAPLLLFKTGRITAERFDEHRRGVFKKLSYLNVAKKFPFHSNHFSSVFSSHVLEHIFPSDVPNLMTSIYRVLRPGGVVRFAVPDLDLYVRGYSREDPNAMLAGILENQGRSSKNRHQWMYTEPTLVVLLKEYGFIDVTPCAYKIGKCEELEIIDNRPENSIYVEGIKPG
jgi:SAM-dependent methyltransferase